VDEEQLQCCVLCAVCVCGWICCGEVNIVLKGSVCSCGCVRVVLREREREREREPEKMMMRMMMMMDKTIR
jgi:hypothetical protein